MSKSDPITGFISNLEEQPTLDGVRTRLEAGDGPKVILDALNAGMNVVGENYATGEYYLAELVDLFTEEQDPHEQLYDFFCQALAGLSVLVRSLYRNSRHQLKL